MSKVKSIEIYWNMSTETNDRKNSRFSINNCWRGNIIIKNDGYFEGIVISNRKNENDTKHFVFGIMNENKKVIYKMYNSDDPVHIYRFEDGTFFAMNENYEYIYGQSKVEISDSNERDYSDLLISIKSFKQNIETEDFEFYKGTSKDIKSKYLMLVS